MDKGTEMKNERPAHFHMNVRLPDGTYTQGPSDWTKHPEHLGLTSIPLAGRRVLDVAANDGFWSFWAEQNGAKDVLAIDVESYQRYDWGHAGPPPSIADLGQQEKDAGFKYLHELLGSQVRREAISTYELSPEKHGVFDIVFMFGLLYHLRHPLMALDILRKVCSGVLIIETHVLPFQNDLPAAVFYMDDVCFGHTNWHGPNEAVIVHWLISAGFPYVFAENSPANRAANRQIFIACVDEEWSSRFTDLSAFSLCDASYLERSRAAISSLLNP
jgi:tRNA (mo5U34)-methyltransferase